MNFQWLKNTLFNSSTSELLRMEQTKWEMPHELIYDEKLRSDQLNDLKEFGTDLKICYKNVKMMDELKYQHWWITDGTWVMEFGGGERLTETVQIQMNKVRDSSILDSELQPKSIFDSQFQTVNASDRSRTKFKDIIIHDRFLLTKEVRHRMEKVCGATNYSLALRNCEHLARYIHSGVWVCFQMGSGGILKKWFYDHMANPIAKLINCPPKDLDKEEVSGGKIFENYESMDRPFGGVAYKFTCHEKEIANESYNILMLGPTGAGKSHLINMIYNEKIVASIANVQSVTRYLSFSQGTCGLYNNDRKVRDVTVIDTIGVCDSLFTEKEVKNMIESMVKLNLNYLDKVVVVCSGRIEGVHARAIKQLLHWLKYPKYKDRFMFIYNKTERLNQTEKAFNLMQMCELLGVDSASDPGDRYDRSIGILPIQDSSLLQTSDAPSGYGASDLGDRCDGSIGILPIQDSSLTSDLPDFFMDGESDSRDRNGNAAIKMKNVMTTGFPPGADYETIKEDLETLKLGIACLGNSKPRIPVHEANCVIM